MSHFLYSSTPKIRRKSTSSATATTSATTTVSSRKHMVTSAPKATTTKMHRAKSPFSPKSQATSATTSPRPEPTIIKRRNSSFANTSSPWFRRNSFLSPTMIQNENFNVYESGNSFYSGMGGQFASNYSIISLRECQGFIFNQDLFATPYQQVRSQANAKKYRSSFSQRGISGGGSRKCRDGEYERRHTSYHSPRPQFGHSTVSDNAIVDDDDDDEEEDHEKHGEVDDEEMFDANEDFISNEAKRDKEGTREGNELDAEEDEDEEEGEDEEEEDDEDDYREMHEYGGDFNNRRYKVRVTEIVVDENEGYDIFPTSEI